MHYLLKLYRKLSPRGIMLFLFFANIIGESMMLTSNADDTALVSGQLSQEEETVYVTLPIYEDYATEATTNTDEEYVSIIEDEAVTFYEQDEDTTSETDEEYVSITEDEAVTFYEQEENTEAYDTVVTYVETEGEFEILDEITNDEYTGSVVDFSLEDSLSSFYGATGTGNEESNSIGNGGIEDTNEDKTIEPSLVITNPTKKPTIDKLGRFDPLSLSSYNVIDENSDMTYCSYVTYLNIKQFVEQFTVLGSDNVIARGNAIDIWEQSLVEEILSGQTDRIFTGTDNDGQEFIDHLSKLYVQTGSTVFDIVTLKPKAKDDDSIGLSVRQSHRFTIVLGQDDNRYVLDPVRIPSSDPIFLHIYLEKHIFDQEDIKIVQSYKLTDPTIQEGEQEEILTPEENDETITVNSPMGFLPYVMQGLISAPNTGDTISNQVIFHTGFRYETLDGNISAYIPAGLVITTADGEDFNPFNFNIYELSGATVDSLTGSENYNNIFKFGTMGQHLVFSQPIGLTLETPDYENGVVVDILVQHEGQEWNKQGLTNNPGATCLADGSVTQGDQIQTGQSQGGKVRFYTCGASSFALGYVPGFIAPTNGSVTTMKEQADGKILIGGSFTAFGSITRNRIARLHPDKSLDLSFNPDINSGLSVYDIKTQPDGKILVAGTFTGVGGVSYNNIVRLHEDGTIDNSFINADVDNQISDIEIQADGKIIIGGTFTQVGGIGRNRIARLHPDGSLDTDFDPNPNNVIYVIEIQSDGKIIIGGSFTQVGGVGRNRIARLNPDGSLDTDFNPNANNVIYDIQLQADGKILIGGNFTTIGGVGRNRIARLNADGTLDTDFNPNANNIVTSMAIQSDGKILIGGIFTTMGGTAINRMARLHTDGSLDTDFNPNPNHNIIKIAILSSGKLLVSGHFTAFGGVTGMARLAFYDDIVFDTRYNVRPNNTINTIFTQADGKILIGGHFTNVGGITRNRIARLNADGSLDTDFDPNLSNVVRDITTQPDGKILVAGTFTGVGGVTQNYLARLHPDGSLDTDFAPNVNYFVNTMKVQADGKILIGGEFTIIGGITTNRMARLHTDGTLDTDFDPYVTNAVATIDIQSDGKILIGGIFTTVKGVTRMRIARLHPDGSLDTDFNPGSSINVNSIVVQPDDKILMGGTFTTVLGVTRNRIARLHADGTLDMDFNPDINDNVNKLYLLENGDIIVGGRFTAVGGVDRMYLAKLSSTGAVDPHFNVIFNANRLINAIDRDQNGNLLVGGSFTSAGGTVNNAYFTWVGLNSTLNNQSLWLRADHGTNCSTDGCPISQWRDSSTYSNHALQTSTGARPIYKDNILNGNPIINFNTTSQHLTSITSGSYKTVFAVRNLAMTGYQSLWSSPANSDFSIRTAAGFNGTTIVDYTDGDNEDWSHNGQLAINGKQTTVGTPQYHIVKAVAETTTTGSYSISTTLSNRGMYGEDGVAELIAYSTDVDADTTNKIESYLAIKYGITLDQSTANGQNYILSNGVISWSTGDAGDYNHDIAGITKDNSMNLLQTRSQSINNTGDIIIQANTAIPNLTSMIWAHDNGDSDSLSTSETPGGIIERISRERHIQEKNGDIGEITITYPIDISGLSTGELALMIDPDGNFGNGGTTLITGTVLSGYRTFVTNLEDDTYISFGIIGEGGDVCIQGPDTFDMGSYSTANTSQVIQVESDYFTVDDQQGSENGYYTTLMISNLTGTSGSVISSASAIQIEATSVDTLSGTANSFVIVDDAITSYIPANTPVTFITRETGTGIGIKGLYGSKINVQITIPAYQQIDTYTGTITYTLYEY